MLGEGDSYRVLLALAFLAGIAAIGFSAFGLFTILTGGTTSGPADADVLGEFACEEFEGDPAPAHDPEYEVERTVLSGTEVTAFNLTRAGDRVRIEVATEGRLLDASARRPDGTNVSVRAVDGENRVVLDHEAGDRKSVV